MNFEKAFKSLSGMVDRSVNYHSYSESKRLDYHSLAYRYKQAIESFTNDSNSCYAGWDIESFEKKLKSFNHNICESGLYKPWETQGG
jgi:hypothetical protein